MRLLKTSLNDIYTFQDWSTAIIYECVCLSWAISGKYKYDSYHVELKRLSSLWNIIITVNTFGEEVIL